ncbi:uncharacterized protein LOC135613905 [Musa acuminata AAA Group]|uniref:uncharacterized protein LOC135613905 n=1 Tax=Musa acuminata AAA Group TaxID=214697 RepID=UPI0031D1F0B2
MVGAGRRAAATGGLAGSRGRRGGERWSKVAGRGNNDNGDGGEEGKQGKAVAGCAKDRFSDTKCSVAHPQTNGQTEVMNLAILEGLKRRISSAHGAWVDELPSVLWAMRTTPKTASGEPPFSLAFRTKAVLPPGMVFLTLCTSNYQQEGSEEGLRANLYLLEERRAKAHLRTLAYKKAMARIYNHKVRPRLIKVRDLILRKAEVRDPTRARGKLTPNWEGPYRVYDMV